MNEIMDGNALDQAINNVGNMLRGAGNQIQQGMQAIGSDIGQGIQSTENFFNPQSNKGNNFWSTPMAQGMANVQQNPATQYLNNQIGQPIEQGTQQMIHGLGPATPGKSQLPQLGNLVGGAMKAGFGVFSATPAGLAFNAANSGLTTAAQYFDQGDKNVAQNFTQNLIDPTKNFAQTGLGLDPNQHPVLSTVANLDAMIASGQIASGLTEMSAKLFGPASSLFGKAIDAIGGGDSGQGLIQKLWGDFGTDTYRFFANKDLIQRVVLGQGSPEDIRDFNILNSLGKETDVAGDLTKVPTEGSVWDFLQTVYPSSFKDGKPLPAFTNPDTTPLAALTEMPLTTQENEALMKVDEKNPSPADQSVEQVKQELLGKKKTFGQIQQEHQRAMGLGALSDFEDAHNANDTAGMQKALAQINSAPADSPLAGYKENMNDLARRLGIQNPSPQAGQIDFNAKIENPFAKKPTDFSQQPTKSTYDFWADAEHQLKYNTALQASSQLPKAEAEELKQLIYNADVRDATNPIEMAGIILKDLPERFQQDKGVLEAFNNYPRTVNQVFNMRISNAAGAPLNKETYQQLLGALHAQPETLTGKAYNFVRDQIGQSFDPQSGKINFGAKVELPKLSETEPLDVEGSVAHEVSMQHPDLAQYSPVLIKAVQLLKKNPTLTVGSISTKVPGFDVALDSLKQQGIPVKSGKDLAALVKGLPLTMGKAPKTAAEALAVKSGQVPNASTAINAEQTVTPKDMMKYGKDLTAPAGQVATKTVIQNAQAEKPQLDSVLGQIAKNNGNDFSSRVKNVDTFQKKIITKRIAGRQYTPFDVNDTYGARITVSDAQAKANILGQLQALDKSGKLKLLNAQNVDKDTYHATHIDLQSPTGTRMEVQLVTPHEKAESLVNHPIRAMFGENPPSKINTVKTGNAKIINQLTPVEAQGVAKRIEAIHQQNPDTAARLPLDLSKGEQVTTQLGGNQIVFKKGQPALVNGVKFDPPALKTIQQYMKQNDVLAQNPRAFAKTVLPDRSWKAFLANNPDFNNHAGGAATIANGKGYFTYLDPKKITPNQSQLDVVIDKRVAKQFKINQPIIVTPQADGTFTKVDGQHRLLSSQALNHSSIPALVLDDNSPSIAKSYQDIKRGISVPSQPVITNSTTPGYDFAADMNRPFEERFPQQSEKPQTEEEFLKQYQVKEGEELPPQQTPKSTAAVKEVPASVIGSDQARQAAGLPLPPSPLKNPMIGTSEIGDVPLKAEANAYAGRGAASMVRGGSLPPVGSTGPQKFNPVQLLYQNLRPMINILKDSGSKDAQNFAQRVEEYQALKANLSNHAQTALENALKNLNPSDHENFVAAAEGKGVPHSEAVTRLLNVWDGVRKDIATKAKALGLETMTPDGLVPWEARENYFPHFATPDQLEQIKNNPKVIDQIIKSGKAKDTFEAQLYLDKLYSNLKSTRYGKLQIQRSDFAAPFIKNPKVLLEYTKGAYNKIAHANYFGTFGQEAQQSINNMVASNNGYEARVAKQLYEKFSGGVNKTPEDEALGKASGFLHNTLTPIFLGPLTAIHHATTIGALAARVGTVNTLKASGELLKGMFGNYSDFARGEVSRLHSTDQTIYGKTTPFIDKYYSAIGLNRTLNALSAFGAHAANSHLDEMGKDLANPMFQRDLQRAGLDAAGIAQRGMLSPVERTQYIQAALRDSSLLLQPGDMPKITEGPIGRLAFMFKGPIYQRTARLMPMLYSEMTKGHITPVAAFAVLSTALGVGEQVAGNIIQNKPAPTAGKLMLQGALRGQGTLGSEEAVNMALYPKYAGQTALSFFGGPTSSFATTIGDAATLGSPQNANDQLTKQRNLMRLIPFVGPTATNTLLPYKSYVGNRPSDIISAKVSGQDISHGTAPFQYTTKPSLMDLVRENPLVQAQNKIINNVGQAKQALMGQLSTTQQAAWTNISNLLQSPYNGTGNKLSSIQGYSQLANDPALAQQYAKYQVYQAEQSGRAVNPLYALGATDPQAYLTILKYKGLIPADQKAFKSDPNNAKVLSAYNAMESDYYQKLPASQQAQSSGITPPSPSAEVKALLDHYSQTKAAGHPDYTALDDPRTQQYFSQLDFYDNYVNNLAGLPAGSGTKSGTGSSYGAAGTAAYMDRALERQYAYANLRASMTSPNISMTLPKQPTKAGGQTALLNQKLPPLKTGLSLQLQNGGSQGMPNFSKKTSIKMPQYRPPQFRATGFPTIL